ncbi:pyrroloquinoline quinone biosynthesis protein PqqB [Saccharopolyspora sp. HNM0986]|uniref:pyrroloquinoline quinone biosynthesis protein PqqB n=1 Tax=Saccharopolyspora galaxeae TaxID=2781241 RepID=UPI00190BA8F4|nr:pyrroloquinoline quinone biosynthesis protein PqqB [Saccharopolyspora sp. HNM0986]MBK0869134.1 pyrroloquinoline quinone biosynthesis protein PqqB [Saccharopolyspora sp. HNM0986]
MLLRCLGVAAGGGYPQWNCACGGCRAARERPERATTHAGLAVSATGRRWFLLNATPDVHHQIAADPNLHPGPGPRDTPVSGVLLTDAEFDHTIGLLVLREGADLAVHGTPEVLGALETRFPVRHLLSDYAEIDWRPVEPGEPIELDERLRATAFRTGGKPPRYVGASDRPNWEVGYRLEDTATGGTAVYAPTVPRWDDAFAAQVADADCVFCDGTFHTDDEMSRQGTGRQPGSSMGHMPVDGPDGSARKLAELPGRKIYVHVNNTNPILDEASAQRRRLQRQGIEVGHAGLEVEL